MKNAVCCLASPATARQWKLSAPSQRAAGESAAQPDGFKVEKAFEDVGESARKSDRPVLKAMLQY